MGGAMIEKRISGLPTPAELALTGGAGSAPPRPARAGTPAAARMRQLRERQRNGRGTYRVECDQVEIEAALEALEYLPRGRDHAKREIEAALTELISRVCRSL
jgi:hypothetical protein